MSNRKEKTDKKQTDGEDNQTAESDESFPESTSAEKEKKRKVLRFAQPERRGEENRIEARSSQEMEIQSVIGYRLEPLKTPGSGRISDVIRAMQADVGEEDSSSSVVYDPDNYMQNTTSFTYKSLFDALRRSPTKSVVDYYLLLSTHLRNLEGVKQALADKANVNVSQDMNTPLIIATENNDKQLVKFLLTVNGVDLNRRNIYGNTALMIAIRSGFDEIAAALIRKGAVLDIQNNIGRTPLHEAMFREDYALVRMLIQYEHRLEIVDCFGEKPIYTCSVKKPNLQMLNLLLNGGAMSEFENETGLSLLSRAILNENNIRVVKRLVADGANVNHQDIFCKRTPLHFAAIINSLPTAKFLIENGSNPELRTISDLTPFDTALYYRSFQVAEYLSRYTMNPSIKLENYRGTLLSRLPHRTSAILVLRSNARE